MVADEFYYISNDGPKGPFAPDVFLGLVDAGIIQPDTLVTNMRINGDWISWSMMSIPWYYTNGKSRCGPVCEFNFPALEESGEIGPETLVWTASFGKEWRTWDSIKSNRDDQRRRLHITQDAQQQVPRGGEIGNATTCYMCGRKIANGELRFRRTVNTGHSIGGWYGFRRRSTGVSTRSYFGLRTLCIECTQQREAEAIGCFHAFVFLFIGVVGSFLFLILIFLLFGRH